MTDKEPVTQEYLDALQAVCHDYRNAPHNVSFKENLSAHVRFGFYACPGLERLISHANRVCEWREFDGDGIYLMTDCETTFPVKWYQYGIKKCPECGGGVALV